MQRAEHIISFGLVYGQPQRSYIDTGIKVRIYYSSAVSAFKTLVRSFPNMFAIATRLACVRSRNNYKFHAIKQCFISKKPSELMEIPSTKFCSKLFVSVFRCKPDIGKVFNRYSLTLLFSRFYNGLTNGVINNSGMSSFFARKPFQEFFTPFSAFALNRTTNLLPMFTVIVKPISRKLNIIRSVSHRSYSHVHTNKLFNILNIFFGYINSLKKVELTFFVNQIRFPFNVRQIVSVMANKRYFQSTTNSPKRNNVIGLVSHYPAIITNASKWTKLSFSFLVEFVRISNLRNATYKNLRRKIEGGFVAMVNLVMQFEVIKNLLFPSHIRYGIANSISLLHGFEKQVSLFVSRQKFNFQCQLHSTKIQNNFIYQKIITNIVKQFNYGAAIPPIGSKADQWVSLPKVK